MAPILKLLSIVLFLAVGEAQRRPNRPNRTGNDDSPAVTNSPDDDNNNNNNSPATTNNVNSPATITNINSPTTTARMTARVSTSVRTSRTSSRTTKCPSSQSSYSYGRDVYCCPGSFYGIGSNALCGIACSGGPSDVTSSLPSGRACASTVMVTDNQYSSKVAAATSRVGTATSPGAAAMITAGPMMGALAVAGGMLLAL